MQKPSTYVRKCQLTNWHLSIIHREFRCESVDCKSDISSFLFFFHRTAAFAFLPFSPPFPGQMSIRRDLSATTSPRRVVATDRHSQPPWLSHTHIHTHTHTRTYAGLCDAATRVIETFSQRESRKKVSDFRRETDWSSLNSAVGARYWLVFSSLAATGSYGRCQQNRALPIISGSSRQSANGNRFRKSLSDRKSVG